MAHQTPRPATMPQVPMPRLAAKASAVAEIVTGRVAMWPNDAFEKGVPPIYTTFVATLRKPLAGRRYVTLAVLMVSDYFVQMDADIAIARTPAESAGLQICVCPGGVMGMFCDALSVAARECSDHVFHTVCRGDAVVMSQQRDASTVVESDGRGWIPPVKTRPFHGIGAMIWLGNVSVRSAGAQQRRREQRRVRHEKAKHRQARRKRELAVEHPRLRGCTVRQFGSLTQCGPAAVVGRFHHRDLRDALTRRRRAPTVAGICLQTQASL
jgi:hypothetical protein